MIRTFCDICTKEASLVEIEIGSYRWDACENCRTKIKQYITNLKTGKYEN